MRFTKQLLGTIGIASMLTGISATAARPTPQCEAQDTYRVTRYQPANEHIGQGYVCENTEEYYGWLSPVNRELTLSELIALESDLTRDSIHQYGAGLLDSERDSVRRERLITAHVTPSMVKTNIPHHWGPIPVTVHVDLKREDGAWTMRALAKTSFVTWKDLRCAVREDLYFSCPK